MNLTIVRADDLVIIDDQPQRFDLSSYSFPAAFWALQWRNDQGEIEFNNAEPNQMITELPEWTTAILAEHARLTEEALQPVPPPIHHINGQVRRQRIQKAQQQQAKKQLKQLMTTVNHLQSIIKEQP